MSCAHEAGIRPTTFGVLRLPRTVVVGASQRFAVAGIAAEIGSNVLVCTDPRVAASEELQELVRTLEGQNLTVRVFGETEAELPVPGIIACVEELKGQDIDVIIGFGGGSCMDMAKVVSVLLTHGGVPSDYYGEFKVPGPVKPVIALPTTAGTGSEATAIAVVSDPGLGMKMGISSPHIIPFASVCDPELTYSCPPSLTAATGADTFVHLIESFTAITRNPTPTLASERVFVGRNVLTNSLALDGIRLVGRSLATAYKDPDNVEARGDMMLAALYGGIVLSNAGTAAAHAIQYPVGALTHTPHGVGVGLLLPYVVRHNFSAIIPQLGQIAEALGRDIKGMDARDAAVAGVEAIDEVIAAIELPSTLAELGVKENDLARIAELSLNSKRLIDNNPLPLNLAAVGSIVQAAFAGDRTIR
ncbi:MULTISPECIES: iron-containing alcohol dehydrogenase [Paenarthrobacter]|uniref:Iron-containing alcohol dehydrogenase n=1 Tax=Paenarthrobacter ureafaciens TaxID=37931 RepID=A0AAX3EMJ0_PAEUR|nr:MULTISPECIES: iron-containing alcohol dehydrogenase [Paenarthrobacter]NKR14060.1 alcohol dehydrogenase [Arthrobacter sp. M5]NKR18332.1 alcohol dehydrogenase [Arthrobacter sp. M6]OEH59336.1 alcohol dehydrogenase [Arthrobacter sp. D2]OEH60681.1 alcohol dehydrogenase [Arthrobacter sp. D4]MDO5864404.1 iron-containing alcohol dehydrogenase [Paenarthrobacter sp. SD-2]